MESNLFRRGGVEIGSTVLIVGTEKNKKITGGEKMPNQEKRNPSNSGQGRGEGLKFVKSEQRRFFRNMWEAIEQDPAPPTIKAIVLQMHAQMIMNDCINAATGD